MTHNEEAAMKTTRYRAMLFALLGVLSAAATAQDTASTDEKALRTSCELLKLVDFATIQDAATRIGDSGVAEASGETPAACLINGYVAPQVGFRLKLPLANWNGKLVQLGTGGYAGSTQVPGDQRWCDEVLRRGYACVHSDYGHTSGVTDKALAALDAVWAHNNIEQELDYGYRGIHVVSTAAKAITQRYYGRAQNQAYFMGCSNGGRQAMVAAQRYPWDFDGIVAMEPAINLSGAFTTFLYNHRSVTGADGKPLFAPTDLELLKKNAVAQCDSDDGLKDGIIGHPAACDVKLDGLACVGDKTDSCLTTAQIAAAKKVYAGPSPRIYRGRPMPGAEPGSFGFAVTRPLAQLALADFFRYLAFYPDDGTTSKLTDFDFERDYVRLSTMEALYQSNNPDLRPFKEAGGKLIMIQGWDDAGTPFPLNTIDYYETMQRTMGGAKPTRDFARLFMAAGRSHCAGGDGASVVDPLMHLENWVERNEAPEVIRAYKMMPGTDIADALREPRDPAKILFSRPLYPYPLQATYKGRGDANDWRSFKPVNVSEIRVR